MELNDFLKMIFRLRRLHRAFFHHVDMHALNLKLNKTQTRTLFVIYHNKENKMGDISHRMGLEKGSFTTLIEHLIEQGYVIKEQNKQDKRRMQLRLTEQGEAVALQIEGKFKQQAQKLLNILTNQEKEELMQAMQVIDKYSDKLEKGTMKNKPIFI